MNVLVFLVLITLPWLPITDSTLPSSFSHQQTSFLKHLDHQNTEQQVVNLQNEREAILVATNQQRSNKRLSELKPDPKLMQAAQQYAELMVTKDQMSHTLNGLSLPDKAKRVGYSFRQLSENIALNTRLDGRFVVVEQWMESKGHRKNLLTKDITNIGIGVAGPSKQNRYYYCQLFGSPL